MFFINISFYCFLFCAFSFTGMDAMTAAYTAAYMAAGGAGAPPQATPYGQYAAAPAMTSASFPRHTMAMASPYGSSMG